MASRGINKVFLVGNLGADPELRTAPNGNTIANIRLATGESWKDQQGQTQERTEWHRVVLFGRTAELARDYVRKGSKLWIEGRLRTRKWQDKNGQDQYTTEIVASDMQMLDRADGQTAQPAQRPAPQQQAQPGGSGIPPVDYDDEYPF